MNTTQYGRLQLQHAERFILGGNAWVQFWNTKTDNSYRYRVKEERDEYFSVYWLDSDTEYYVGSIRNREYYIPGDWYKKSCTQVFAYVWKHICQLDLEDFVHVQHMGRCSVCGKSLIDSKSIEIGIGPKCLKKVS